MSTVFIPVDPFHHSVMPLVVAVLSIQFPSLQIKFEKEAGILVVSRPEVMHDQQVHNARRELKMVMKAIIITSALISEVETTLEKVSIFSVEDVMSRLKEITNHG